MTAKQFFKSTVFKCLATLLCILLISGVFLSVMNSLLYVSEKEIEERGIKKAYGQVYEPKDTDKQEKVFDSATIIISYEFEINAGEADYLIRSVGKEGYQDGTVTCWVAITVNKSQKKIIGIRKVLVQEYKAQTLMSNFKNKFFKKFTQKLEDFYDTKSNYVVAGATMSSTAICNAVNGAIQYVKEFKLGQTTTNPFDGFEYIKFISIGNPDSKFEIIDGNKVKYSIVTKGTRDDEGGSTKGFTIEIVVNVEKAIESYKIVADGSTQGYGSEVGFNFEEKTIGWKNEDFLKVLNDDQSKKAGTVSTGASLTYFLCAYAGLFATANYDKCISGGQQ